MADNPISKVMVPVTVVGLQQCLYAADGGTGDLIRAVTYAEALEVDALEGLATDAAAVVRERQKRMDELGRALGVMSKAKAYLDTKSKASDSYGHEMSYVYNLQNLYGYPFGLTEPSVNKATVEAVQSNVQHQSDLMGNRLNQATTSLHDYIERRDKIYSQLEKAVGKIQKSTAAAIREMG